MATMKQQTLADRNLVVHDTDGGDAVRISLQYLPTLTARSRGARVKALRSHFEKVAKTHAATGVELHPDSLSESGQVIEALVPADRYEQAIHELEGDDIRVDLVQAFQATL
jgi:hypothetical protein